MGVPRLKWIFLFCLLFLLPTGLVWAQGGEMSRGPFSATVTGSTGLFTIYTADTMKRGEFAVTISHHNISRDPGDINVHMNPVSITYGLTNRIEAFATANFNQSVEVDGKYLPSPTTRIGNPFPTTYRYRYYHDYPFMNHGFSNGMGDILVGLKMNILSEEQNSLLGLALRGFVKIPSTRTAKELQRGRGTGEVDGGVDLIISKRFGPVGTHYNVGFTFVGNPGADGNMTLDLRDEFRAGFGLNAPITKKIQGVFEVNSTTFFGQGTPISGPVNPVDLFGGIRYFPNDWLYMGAGYRHFINSTDSDPAQGTFSTDHHGFTVQVGFQNRKNSIPVVQCNLKSAQIIQGESTQLTANATDADYNSRITYQWSATEGKIEGEGQSVVFRSDNLKPGSYSVTVTAKDNRGGQSTCSKQITVLKRNSPPTVRIQPARISITLGETTTLKALAEDPDKDPLTFQWTIDGEKVASKGDELVFGSEGRNLGDHAVTVTVSDGEASAQAKSVVQVLKPVVNLPPTVRCEVERADLMSGESVTVRAVATDPENDNVTLEWSASAGSIEGSGAQVTFRARSLTAGAYVIRVRATDSKGASGNSNCLVRVREKMTIRLEMLRVDNIAKGMLDDIALRMQSDPRLNVNLVGYSDQFGSKKVSESAAQQRADAVKDYLVKSHHIDASRISVKNGGVSNPVAPNTTLADRKKNRRVELELFIP